jgi:CRISPR-associated endoribonuclease Cas6
MEEMGAAVATLLSQARLDSAPEQPVQGQSMAADLAPLWFVRYRLRLVPRAPLVLPVHGRGAILRGAFGITLRGLVCHDLTLECRACPVRAQCPYPDTFEPAPPEGGDRLSNFSDIPRPFVFDPPTDERAEFRPGETVEFGLTAVGRASRLVPYFVTAFRKLADDGIGPRRARFDLVEVVALGLAGPTSIYKNTEPLVRIAAPTLRASDLVRPNDASRTRLTLRFATPVDLRDRGAPVETPELGPLVRRLRDRASSLAVFFGDGPLELDFKGVSALADAVRLVENRTRVVTVNRRSSKTGQRHDVGGFVGQATYEGEAIGRLMPLLRVGEVVHVGKHAAFGNGGMEVVG